MTYDQKRRKRPKLTKKTIIDKNNQRKHKLNYHTDDHKCHNNWREMTKKDLTKVDQNREN